MEAYIKSVGKKKQIFLDKMVDDYGKKMWWNGLSVGFLAGSLTVILLEVIDKWRK